MRTAQPAEEIPRLPSDFVGKGVLDGDRVALAGDDLDRSWRVATPPPIARSCAGGDGGKALAALRHSQSDSTQ